MQASNNVPSLTALRQPSRLSGGQDNQKLVFLYPVLCSNTLSKYSELFRNFLSVEFLSQIKISNGLNITSKLSRVGTIGIGDQSITPELEVRNTASNFLPLFPINSRDNKSVYDDYSNEFKRQQQLIKQFSTFFLKQISINPKYKPYNPIVSTVTSDENHLVFPIIVGTKKFDLDVRIIFYILSTALAFDLSLDSAANLEHCLNYIKNTDLTKFNNIFDIDYIQDNRRSFLSGNFRRLPEMLRTDVRTRSDENRKLFRLDDIQHDKLFLQTYPFVKVLKFQDWDAESDHMMSQTMNLNMDAVPIIQTATQRRHFEAAMNSFNSYVSETVIPILYNLETVLGPTPPHINYHSAVQDLLNNVTRNMDQQYMNTANHIRLKLSELPPQIANNGDQLTSRYVKTQTKFTNTQFRIDDIKSFCQNSAKLSDSIKKIINDDLIPTIKKFDPTDPNTVNQFCDVVVQTSSKFQPLSNTIESWAINAIPGSTNNGNGQDTNIQDQFNTIKQHFHNSIINFFESPDDPNYALFDRNLDPNVFLHRYPNFSQIFCGNNNPHQCQRVFIQVISQIEQSLEDILFFYFIWNFIRYICSYINEVDIDIQIQKKDVLDFPNYTLILPIEIFKFLYVFHTSNRLKAWMRSPGNRPGDTTELATSVAQQLSTFVPNADTKKMIEILNDRLKIPNIIVVDQFKKEVYYQFMYMSKPLKINLDSLTSYIKDQKEILTNQ